VKNISSFQVPLFFTKLYYLKKTLCKTKISVLEFLSHFFIGIFGVPKDICTQQYQKAVKEFSHKFHRDTIKEIHFVDIDKGMCSLIQKTFGSEFGNGIKM
jgi:hypothetical protein